MSDKQPPSSKARKQSSLLEIGWREMVSLPDLSDEPIRVKVDTGAATSALHAFKIKEFAGDDGQDWIRFLIHPRHKAKRPECECVAPIKTRRRIRSSNGQVQERVIIRTRLKLGGRSWPIDLSLTNRDEMGFRMLLGREALKPKIVIHPSKSYLQGSPRGKD
ncbi:MAG: RimK/LysX family protein [Pseudomonadota bacterium]